MGSSSHRVATLMHRAAQNATGPRLWAIFCFAPFSSFSCRNLAKFNRMRINIIKSKMAKRGKAKKWTGWCIISLRLLFSPNQRSSSPIPMLLQVPQVVAHSNFWLELLWLLHNFCSFFNFVDICNCIKSSLNFMLLSFKCWTQSRKSANSGT